MVTGIENLNLWTCSNVLLIVEDLGIGSSSLLYSFWSTQCVRKTYVVKGYSLC